MQHLLAETVLQNPELLVEASEIIEKNLVHLQFQLKGLDEELATDIRSRPLTARERRIILCEHIWDKLGHELPLFDEGKKGEYMSDPMMTSPRPGSNGTAIKPSLDAFTEEAYNQEVEETAQAAAEEEEAPREQVAVKRGRGRPRKNPLPEGAPAPRPTAAKPATVTPVRRAKPSIYADETPPKAAPRPAAKPSTPAPTKVMPLAGGGIDPALSQALSEQDMRLRRIETSLGTVLDTQQKISQVFDRLIRGESLLLDSLTAIASHLGRAVFANAADNNKLKATLEGLKKYYMVEEDETNG